MSADPALGKKFEDILCRNNKLETLKVQKKLMNSVDKQDQKTTGQEKQMIHPQIRTAMKVNGKHISGVFLGSNFPSSPIRRHKLADWVKKQNPTMACIQESYLSQRCTHRLKIKL